MPAPPYVNSNSRKKLGSRSSTLSSSDDNLPLAFSGWIHVAVTSCATGRKKFKKRYCKLRDAKCTFYDSIGQKAKPQDRHVIVSVSRLHEVNQGILLIDHHDQFVNLFTDVAEDYQMWYSAFEEALASARASSTSSTSSSASSSSSSSSSRRYDERSSSPLQETLAKLKLKTQSDSSMLASEQSRSIWMHKETTALFVKKMKRRYFVLNGNFLSYFDVNMEGRAAEGSGYVTSVQHWHNTPNGLEIQLDRNDTIRVATKTAEEAKDWYRALRSVAHPKKSS